MSTKKYAANSKTVVHEQEITPIHEGGDYDQDYLDAILKVADQAKASNDHVILHASAVKMAKYFNTSIEEWL